MLGGNVRGLDLSGRDCGLLVVCGQLGCLCRDALEDICNVSVTDQSGLDRLVLTVDEGIQDGHGTVGDAGIWVDLLEDCLQESVHCSIGFLIQTRSGMLGMFFDVMGVWTRGPIRNDAIGL